MKYSTRSDVIDRSSIFISFTIKNSSKTLKIYYDVNSRKKLVICWTSHLVTILLIWLSHITLSSKWFNIENWVATDILSTILPGKIKYLIMKMLIRYYLIVFSNGLVWYKIQFKISIFITSLLHFLAKESYKRNECKECMEWYVKQSMHLRLVTNSLSEY